MRSRTSRHAAPVTSTRPIRVARRDRGGRSNLPGKGALKRRVNFAHTHAKLTGCLESGAMRGRKPNPHRFGLVEGGATVEVGGNGPKKAKRGRPAGRPAYPAYFSDAQRAEFNFVCRLLEDENLLTTADQGDIICMALARDQLREAEESLQEDGRYTTETVPGAWVRCPTCKGASARSDGPKCKTCKSKGALQKKGRRERRRNPAAADRKEAIDQIVKISAALGLDPTSRTRLKGKAPSKPATGLKSFLDHAHQVRG